MNEDNSSWEYKKEGANADLPANRADPSPDQDNDSQEIEVLFSWAASEYSDHDKTTQWFVILGVGSLLLAAILYFLTKSWFSAGLAPVLAIMIGVFARNKPKNIEYEIDNGGVVIDKRFHPYSEFKSFMLIQEGGQPSILLLPSKRFMPPLTLFFTVDQTEPIVNSLGEFLPFEHGKLDPIERLARRLRF